MTMYSDSSCLAAVFDIDGTLIDSMEEWRFASERYLMSLGLPTNAVDTVQAFDSGGLRLASKRILEVYPQLGPRESLIDAITTSTLPLYRDSFPEIPHALDFLQKLHQEGITLCALTANHRQVIEPGLSRLNMLPLFSNILYCGEISKTKEDTSAYDYCIKTLGLSPARCVMFEDQPWAAANAKAAGMHVVGVCKKTDPKRLSALTEHCNLVISDYIDLLEMYFESPVEA
ncbi:HAD family phosphatase [Ruthenibacterium lactatiformans]|nr:HAD family phosphatase [Ruthenibacterium lactatiformans]